MPPDTRSTLIDTATALVRRQGYAGFSYADLADAVGIRKASIHHHFPAKEDLGLALVAAYSEYLGAQLERIAGEFADGPQRLAAYAMLYRAGLPEGLGCLCGVLASELTTLPAPLQAAVHQFFSLHLGWLERTLRDGTGLRPTIEPARDARTVLSTLQGGLFLALSLKDFGAFDQAVEGLIASLRAPGA